MRNNENVKKAIQFASKAHEGQTYSDVYSYVRHLEMVYEVLVEFGFGEDETLMVSGWLHDVIEDTDASYQTVKKEFGLVVAEAVYGVTDEIGRNRKEKKAKTYPKIRDNDDSLALKLADRIANVKFSCNGVFGNPSKFNMYRDEQEEFELELWYNRLREPDAKLTPRGLKLLNMWEHLRNLLK